MFKARIKIGHFARIPERIVLTKMSPTARRLCEVIALMSSPEKPSVYLNQNHWAKELQVTVKTIYNAIQELIKLGILKFHNWSGRTKRYLFAWVANFKTDTGKNFPVSPENICEADQKKIADITEEDNQNKIQQQAIEPEIATPAAQVRTLRDGRFTASSGRTGNKFRHRERSAAIQAEHDESFETGATRPPQDERVAKKLHSFQIKKDVVVKLINKFGEENCENQIAHLEAVLKKGKIIQNKAAWLVGAIKNEYYFLPTVGPVVKPQGDVHDRHCELAQQAWQSTPGSPQPQSRLRDDEKEKSPLPPFCKGGEIPPEMTLSEEELIPLMAEAEKKAEHKLKLGSGNFGLGLEELTKIFLDVILKDRVDAAQKSALQRKSEMDRFVPESAGCQPSLA